MTFPTTDSISLFAVSLSEKPDTLLIIVISVVIFIAVSVISGILAYKLKLRKIRQNKEKDDENIKR